MAADEFPIAGEGHVALEDAGAHARARFVALLGMFRELQRAATAVADGEGGLGEERTIRTPLEFVLQPARVHFFDEVERPWAELDVWAPASVIVMIEAIGSRDQRDSREEGTNGCDGKCLQTLMHTKLLLVW